MPPRNLWLTALTVAAALLAAGAAAAATGAAGDTTAVAPTSPPGKDPALWETPALLRAVTAAADPARAPARQTAARAYDVLDYTLDFALDIGAERLRGAVTMTLRAAADLAQVEFDLGPDLAVDTLLWNDAPTPAPERTGDLVLVTLPAPCAAGAEGALRIAYSGRPLPPPPLYWGLMFRSHGSETADPTDDGPVVANVSEPTSAHSWWPCRDDPADKATATIAITVPDSLSVVSNGVLVAETTPAPGWRRSVWRERYPIATYLVSIAVSNYVRWDETCDCAAGALPLSFHVFPQDLARARIDLAPTCDMVRFLEEIAGPYPFAGEKYAQAAIRWGGAMENQTATSFGQFCLQGDGRHAPVFVHELAHQWFGDFVTPARWQDVWLNEGFARYAEALWIERTQGVAAYLAEMQRIGPVRHADLFTQAGILIDPIPVLPNSLVYDKGAWVLHMLRGRLGDAVFFRFLRAWTGDPARAFGNATTADLVATASAVAGEDLGPALRPWLETAAVPELAWQARARVLPNGRTRVTLEIAQRQTPLFLLDVPVRITTDDGTNDRRAPLRGRGGVYHWTVDGRVVDATRDITLDPDGWLLWRAADGPAFVPAVTLLAVTPNPARADGATFSFQVREPGRVTANLYDARGRRVGSWDLGERRPGSTGASAATLAGDDVQTWRWRGRDDGDRSFPAGVYWLALCTPAGRAVQKLTLLP